MFPIKCKRSLPVQKVVINSISVRGRLGPLTVWVTKDDEGASSKLLYRGSITEVVRECNSAGTFLNIRVGVRGRYLSGPQGNTGTFDMPVRVAVTQGDAVLYSTLHQIPATLQPGQQNDNFAYVDENISIPKPDSENIIIYVGYDEGPYDTQ